MTLQLDPRQRAMLRDMGVPVWLPAPPAMPPVGDPVIPKRAESVWPGRAQVGVPGSSPANAPQPVSKPAPVMPQAVPADWPALAEAVAQCQACALCHGRKAPVLGSGAVRADWLVVGDAPDEDEEREGLAFAGQAGQLLDNMLKAVGAGRAGEGRGGAYVTNVVKCRPVGARNPQAEELASCEAHLRRQVALVQPKVILAMGRFAVQTLLQSSVPDLAAQPLGKLRGGSYRYQGVPVIVTYPPKALLRSLSDKAKAWADLCAALALVDGSAGTTG
jgi:DNA polymerase